MRNDLCDYAIEDETKCFKCNSECALNKNPDAEANRAKHLDLINEYKRKLNWYKFVKGEQNGKHKSL